MPYYVYIIFSPSADKYYVGHTDSVIRRLSEHNHPIRTKYTSKHKPWELKWFFEVSDQRSDAMMVEKYIKRQKSKQYIQELIKNKKQQEKLFNWLESRCIGINQGVVGSSPT